MGGLSGEDLIDLEDVRRCGLCGHVEWKNEMRRLVVDEPGNWQWVCAGCQEQAGMCDED